MIPLMVYFVFAILAMFAVHKSIYLEDDPDLGTPHKQGLVTRMRLFTFLFIVCWIGKLTSKFRENEVKNCIWQDSWSIACSISIMHWKCGTCLGCVCRALLMRWFGYSIRRSFNRFKKFCSVYVVVTTWDLKQISSQQSPRISRIQIKILRWLVKWFESVLSAICWKEFANW